MKLQILDFHIKNGKQYIDDVAVIEPLKYSEATKELLNSEDNTLVYHTSKVEISLKIRDGLGLRRVMK